MEATIHSVLAGSDQLVQDYVREVAQGVGKRLRPQLLILFADLCGTPDAHRVRYAAACCELLHTVSLIHDDVIDEAETRRGLRTLNTNHGNEIAVIVGDYILALAFEELTRLRDFTMLELTMAASKQLGLGVIQEVRHRERLNLTAAEYFEVLGLKTGSLFGLVCEGGAYLGGAGEAGRAQAREFGHCFGLGFQVVDDLLDLTLTEEEAGKPTFNDLKEGRITLPLLFAAEIDSARTSELVAEFRRKPSAGAAARVRNWLADCGALRSAHEQASAWFDRAQAQLHQLVPACSHPELAESVCGIINQVLAQVPKWVLAKRGCE